MTVNTVLALVLAVLMLAVGGRRGARSLLSMALHFIIFCLLAMMLAVGFSPIATTLAACAAVSAIVLFFINGRSEKTQAAFLSVLLAMGFSLALVYWFSLGSHIQGFAREEVEAYIGLNVHIGVSFRSVAMAGCIIGLIGALVDAAVSISSAVYQVHKNNPRLGAGQLFLSGMAVGRDILCTNTNTLFFAFAAGFVSLFIWMDTYAYSLSDAINSRIFAGELISMAVSAAGCVLVIPLCALVSAYLICRRPGQEDEPGGGDRPGSL